MKSDTRKDTEELHRIQIDLMLENRLLAPRAPQDPLADLAPDELKRKLKALRARIEPGASTRDESPELPSASAEALVLFIGAGPGGSIRRFCKRHANRCVWFEPDELLLAAALRLTDVRSQLRSGQLRIVPGRPSRRALEEVFRGHAAEDVVLFVDRLSRARGPEYDEIADTCENYLRGRELSRATVARFSFLWEKNLRANAVRLAAAQPVARLFGSRPGARALVCGAGPSLADSFDELRKLRDESVLIAADTALGALAAAGIDPDLVVTIDPQSVNRIYLEGYQGGAEFVVDPACSYHALRLLPPDRTYYMDSPLPLARNILSRLLAAPDDTAGELVRGGSVSVTAFDLAVKLGCKTIYLFGQDLSFPDGEVHVRGATPAERASLHESRITRKETRDRSRVRSFPELLLPAIGGGEVASNEKFEAVRRQLEARIAESNAAGVTVVNCTARGARLAGAADGGGERPEAATY